MSEKILVADDEREIAAKRDGAGVEKCAFQW